MIASFTPIKYNMISVSTVSGHTHPFMGMMGMIVLRLLFPATNAQCFLKDLRCMSQRS